MFQKSKIFAVFVVFSLSTELYAEDSFKAPIRKIQTAIGQLVVNRVVIDSVAGRCKNFWSCQNDSARLREQLDYRFEFDHRNHVNLIMRPDVLLKLVRKPEVSSYLNQMRDGIHLWKYTLESTHGNEFEALERIAVLFQDISKSNPDLIPPQVIFLQSRNLHFEADLLLHALKVVRQLSPDQSFPSEVFENDAGIYHFYVSAYLSKKLEEDEFASRSAALFAPFLFNLSYEAVKYDWLEKSIKEGEWSDLWGLFKKIFLNRDLLYRDLRKIDPTNHRDYRGLVGTWAGLSGSAWVTGQSLPKIEKFVSEFSKDPNLWIDGFLRQ